MKPRIYKSNGIWVCFTLTQGSRKAAAGATPVAAYNNWHSAYLGGAAWLSASP